MAAAIQDKPITSYPVYWFAQLEQAIERGDLRTAADAQDRLRQMGVEVKLNLRAVGRQREVCHA